MSRSTPTQLRNSYTKPKLSPASSQSAAAAEADTIRRLRREVLGLTLAVDSMKKNSKEWEFLNSKLEVAREELDAVLEDEQLFRSISPAQSGKKTLTTRSISEENCNELMQMIPTPPLTPPSVVSNRVEELEDKLSQQVKYSLEWFETKKQIDAEKKKCKHDTVPCATVNVNLDKKFFRSSTMGSIVTPIQSRQSQMNMARREGIKKLPSTGASKSERLRPTAVTKMKDQNIQCLKDLLDDVPKYSLEWFEIKRIMHRRSNKDLQRRKSLDSEQIMKANSTKDVATQQKQQDSPSNDNRSHCNDAKESTDLISTEHTLSISEDLDADLVVPNSKAIQDTQRLQDFLEKVPKYSR